MKPIHIFAPGRHTAMGGATLSFSEADLAASAAAYDPAVHEAPIVVGHPRGDAPAYGWVKSLAFAEASGLTAEPDQVDAAFAELVTAGRFKKVSASFYTPDAPANPKPGVYYLRHVGFLGAQPPAVKGLRAVEFASDDGTGIVEFGDWGDVQNAGLWRRMRDWMLTQFGKEAADQVVPDYVIDNLQAEAARPVPEGDAVKTMLYGEGDPTVNAEQLAAQKAALDEREAALATREATTTAKEASFAERETALATAEKARRTAEITEFVADLVKAGQLLPRDQAKTIAFMETFSADVRIVEFAEGDKTVEKPAMQVFREFLKSLPKQVDFSERAKPTPEAGAVDANDADAISRAAVEFQESEKAAGRHVAIDVAVQHVMDKRAA